MWNSVETYEQSKKDVLAQGKTLVVKYGATWCGPCKKVEPTFDGLVQARPDLVFAKVDIDRLEGSADLFDVGAIPCVKIFIPTHPSSTTPSLVGRNVEVRKVVGNEIYGLARLLPPVSRHA